MSLQKTPIVFVATISCDKHGCDASKNIVLVTRSYEERRGALNSLRESLQSEGWTTWADDPTMSTYVDYCPDHKPDPTRDLIPIFAVVIQK